MGKPKMRECVYCGKVERSTRDHVIPETLFEQPYPPNLITVSACKECNNDEKSLDDTYLRDILVCDIFGNQHENAAEGFQRLLRADRNGQSEIAREARAHTQMRPMKTIEGVYLGDFPSFSIDQERLIRIFARIARGLYHDARKARIPDNYIVKMRRHYPWDISAINSFFESRHPNSRALGDVFQCSFLSALEDPFTTEWLMLFYGSVCYSVSITNPDFLVLDISKT